jgi:carboxyl-terminal processing protease
MTAKFAAPLSRPRTVVLAFVFLAVLVTGAWMLQRGTVGNVLPPVHGTMLFDQVRTYVEQRYLDSVGESQAYQMAIRGAIQELDDPNSAFLTPTRYSRLDNDQSSNQNDGIGVSIGVSNGFAFVTDVVKDSPAERAGILIGDRIVEVGGKSIRYWTPDEVLGVLRGAPGSTAKLTIEHPGSGTTVPVVVKRAVLYRSTVRRATMLPGNIGYVSLWAISDSTAHEMKSAVDSLKKAGATTLMVDIRGTSGGSLTEGVHVAELFLDSAQRVVSTRGRVTSDNHDYIASKSQAWPTLPMAVLVDERTAGAAELFAGALQDHDRASIIGRTTFGSGSAQTVFPLGDDGALKLTTALWHTPSGRPIAVLANPDKPDSDNAPTYKTDDGRSIVSKGGITPDLTAGDSVIPAQEIAFLRGVGNKMGVFEDILSDAALSVKAQHKVTAPNFVVTQPILDDLYSRMQKRSVDVPRTVYDDARPLVARLLSYKIALDVFGQNVEFLRKANDDPVIRTASNIVKGARTPRDVFDRIVQAGKTHPASAQ